MPRKLFIVARGNDVIFGQLQRSVGREPGVEIIFDRRRPPSRSGPLERAVAGVKGMLRRSVRPPGRRRFGRQRRTSVAHDLETRGWAVVHLDETVDI